MGCTKRNRLGCGFTCVIVYTEAPKQGKKKEALSFSAYLNPVTGSEEEPERFFYWSVGKV